MTTTTETAPQRDESLSALISRLESARLARTLIDAVIDRIRRDEAAATATAARLYFGKEPGGRLSRLDFADQLNDITRRAYGVAAAVECATEGEGFYAEGARQLSNDLAGEVKRLAEAFDAERTVAVLDDTATGATLDTIEDEPKGTLSPFAIAAVECQARQIMIRRLGKSGHIPAETVAEAAAHLLALATTPCLESDISDKLRLILQAHKEMHPRWREEAAPAIMAAVNFHFGGEEAETTDEIGRVDCAVS
jgi:hypothetical protein